mmetsp:Transcript_59754/g.126534  ORF Transcript_59754/g.126534 Transcript_59754/m.126534 type:complete len:126 (-) Transcript_59754:123-500(-)
MEVHLHPVFKSGAVGGAWVSSGVGSRSPVPATGMGLIMQSFEFTSLHFASLFGTPWESWNDESEGALATVGTTERPLQVGSELISSYQQCQLLYIKGGSFNKSPSRKWSGTSGPIHLSLRDKSTS